MQYQEQALAKINLHLEVLNRRRDGYHNIFSLMASVGLFDLLKLENIDLRIGAGACRIFIFSREGKYSEIIKTIPANKNTVYRAIEAYCKKAGLQGTISVNITKNIPIGAGLGGGSTDAAAVLRLLNRYCLQAQLPAASKSKLYAISETIGSDVPFCLEGGFAFCEGRGEIITPVFSKMEHFVLVVFNNISIDTGKAYSVLNREQSVPFDMDTVRKKKRKMSELIKTGDINVLKNMLRNDFEEPVFEWNNELREIKHQMQNMGALYAALTGSGSAVIGLFKEKEKALAAKSFFMRSVAFCENTHFDY